MIFFRVNCVPPTTTHHSKKIVRVAGFSNLADSDALVATKETLYALLCPHKPDEPMLGPLSLTISLFYPFPKSTTKKVLAEGTVPKITKPDCSNVAKTIEDAMVRMGFLVDDNQIAELRVFKYMTAGVPGMGITLREFVMEDGTL